MKYKRFKPGPIKICQAIKEWTYNKGERTKNVEK